MNHIILAFGILCTLSCEANTSSEVIDFGKDILQTRYEAFADKMNQCDKQARNTNVSNETLVQLQKIPSEAALALAVVNYKALQQCALYEYSEALRTLVSLENLDEFNPSTDEALKINRIKALLVADMNMYIEKEYAEISPELKVKLEGMAELKFPFNLSNTIEKAWPSSF
ncbi:MULTISPECIES: hypothetical protein [unclassified Agarivorans]|uniref:hypothetical protein n=1 Tax=unclassified Agarivorans TaxID=2636026 RepID=UPI003D7EB250